MIKKLLIIVLLPVALFSKAQVTVSVQLPAAGMLQKDQLWNIVVVNNNTPITDAFISLDIQDAVTGQTVLSAVGRNFILGKGVKVINIRDVQPLQYNYLAAELTGTYIPLGSYVACYRVIKNDITKGPLPVGDECVRINISPLSPPMLNTPGDQSVIETNYPQFSWLPPAPVDMFSSLNYELLVTEVLPGQSPAEAILYNTPVYSNHNLRVAFENYPSTFSRLKEGQQYAWQVTARNGLNYAAQTEVWSFTIKPPDSVKAQVSSDSYIVLKNSSEPSGISYINEADELQVKYYSFDKDHETSVRLLSADGKEIKEVKRKISYGNNFLRFKLNNEFKKETVYIIELTDQHNNVYRARFSIK